MRLCVLFSSAVCISPNNGHKTTSLNFFTHFNNRNFKINNKKRTKPIFLKPTTFLALAIETIYI